MQADIWNLCFEAVSRSRSGLSRFFHSLLKTCACAERAPGWKTWPIPLPFPEMHGKRANRRQPDCARKMGVNFVILILNWMALGETFSDLSTIGLGTKLNYRQWCAVKRFVPMVDAWNHQGQVDSDQMGRTAAKFENVEALIASLELEAMGPASDLRAYLGKVTSGKVSDNGHFGHPGTVLGSLSSSVEHVAKEVEPDRFRFHGTPSFDPSPFLDDFNRARFQRPLDYAADFEEVKHKVPQVRIRCSRSNLLPLLETLDSGSHLALLPYSKVRRGLENGMFSIPKDAERDRMILDARPANCCELSEDRWVRSLGSLQQFQHIFLDSKKVLVMHCEDLREFYHAFEIGSQRKIRNALKAKFRPAELQHLKCYESSLAEEEWVVPAPLICFAQDSAFWTGRFFSTDKQAEPKGLACRAHD